MKYMVASDLHGSKYYAEKLLERFEKEKASKLILLGDLYYHGPRNPLPEGHDAKGLYELLNARKDDILAVRGNCDAEIDLMVSEFPIPKHLKRKLGGKQYFFTHGHVYDKTKIPPSADVIVYGHYHVNFIEKIGEKWAANPGSVSLPKGDSFRGYLILDGTNIVLKDLDGTVRKEVKVK